MEYLFTALPFIIIFIIIFSIGYVKAPPDKAYIISGMRRQAKIIIGRASVRIPFIERMDKLSLSAMQVDVKTTSAVPTADFINVTVDSVVNIKIPKPDSGIVVKSDGKEISSEDMLRRAMQNFLNAPDEDIIRMAKEILEGNIREIVGQMQLKEMVSNRQKFAELVKQNAAPDLAELGLVISSFNVQNFTDQNGVISDLGIDNIETIKKNAAIAKATAKKEVEVAESKARKEANDARVESERAIAEQNNALAIQKADLKRTEDTRQAIADSAHQIETEKQRRTIELESAAANIAKEEKAIEVARQQALVKEQELEATVRKEADAELYRRQKSAEADKYERETKAAADLEVVRKEAEALRAKAQAEKDAAEFEAAGIKARGEAEAAAIEAQGLAKAAGLDAEAEAMRKMEQAAVISLIMEKMPAIAEAVAAPLANVDNITMYGNGNVARLVEEVTTSTSQISNGLLDGVGIDLKGIINAMVSGRAVGAGIAAGNQSVFVGKVEKPVAETLPYEEESDVTGERLGGADLAPSTPETEE